MSDALIMLISLLVGAAAAVLVVSLWRRKETAVAQRSLGDAEESKARELAAITEQLKTAFSALSREALSSNADDFLKLAKTRFEQQTVESEKSLETKKKLIDARLEEMGTRLTELNRSLQATEKRRAEVDGSISAQIQRQTQETLQLHKTTAQLKEALSSSQRRGQWGERMAEDVLRLAGFVEGVNYLKQSQIAGGTRPDFTFLLPDDRRVHMDVKFPLANYMKVLDAKDEPSRTACVSQFLKDVRNRVKEVTTREYIDPAAGTVDYVLVFIPNEQIYGFIHEHDGALLDDALRRHVVLCSPMTLYAILAVMRQTADNFRLEQGSKQILELLAEFKKQWGKYVDGMGKMGARLESAMNEYQELVGVRTRQLDRQLDKIEDLQTTSPEQSTASLNQSTATSAALPDRSANS